MLGAPGVLFQLASPAPPWTFRYLRQKSLQPCQMFSKKAGFLGDFVARTACNWGRHPSCFCQVAPQPIQTLSRCNAGEARLPDIRESDSRLARVPLPKKVSIAQRLMSILLVIICFSAML